jgi:2-polyprenyl-3-methyl-5-hydroxy-6-metoxy-1,4-benzoquinol methylase
MSGRSIGGRYFEALYACDSDPWRATSEYERDKYHVTLNALLKPRYESALEVGCSIGALTRMLADRCDRLLAIDIASLPLSEARRRSEDAPWVRFAKMATPGEWPEEQFELILLSEVLLSRPRRMSRYWRAVSRPL